ncbi:MAG TPA: hypothetical protein VES60_17390 [Nakamurella sp.]|nr:hypothetical protein [Nakamurella sp.]
MARGGRLLLVGAIIAVLGLAPAPVAAAATPADAVADAVNYAANRSVTPFISVVDRGTGAITAQTGNAQAQVASESIMKLLLASYYLVLYGGYTATPDSVKNQLAYMLEYSDDDTASKMFSADAVPTIAARDGLGNTTNATDRVGHWGAVRITAGDMTNFLFRASQDPAVGPWLIPVMAQTAPNGSDGFDQHFGLNAVSGDHGSKQGWGCDSFWTSPSCAIHSVGYTDRSFVAVLQLSTGYPDPMRDTSTHAATVIQASTTRPLPTGSLDVVANPANDLLTAVGWAADPEAPGQSEAVHVYVTGPGGSRGTAVSTGGSRPDVAAAYPWAGGATGFSAGLPPMGEGTNSVCAYAIEVNPPRTNPLLGCRTIQVRNAVGYLDGVGVDTRQIVTAGWALNPNNPGEHVEIHVYDTGPSGTRGYPGFRADGDRPDVAWVFPGYGADHGYRTAIPSVEVGTHSVCTYAITTGGGAGNALLGCRTIQVLDAFGSLDLVGTQSGQIVATGWALNPNDPGGRVQIHVYDASAAGTEAHAGYFTGGSRPDVAGAYPGFTTNSGYWASFPARPGGHTVCAYAITTGGGASNPLLGCRRITVAG